MLPMHGYYTAIPPGMVSMASTDSILNEWQLSTTYIHVHVHVGEDAGQCKVRRPGNEAIGLYEQRATGQTQN